MTAFPSETEIRKKLKDKGLDFSVKQPLLKQLLGWQVAKRVKTGQKLGLGHGTTSMATIGAIGTRVQAEGLEVYGLTTSQQGTDLAQSLGIKLLDQALGLKLDWGFDGADEVELETLNMIKGGGGAATLEKQVARQCQQWLVLVDESKLVKKLGRFPVAVEVKAKVKAEMVSDFFLAKCGAVAVKRRQKDGQDFVTTNNHQLYDVQFKLAGIKPEWEQEWLELDWLIDSGLFMGGYPNEVLVAYNDGQIKSLFGPGKR